MRRRFCDEAAEEETAVSFHVQDEADFRERVIDSSVPVIADFHADWCGPCKQLGPRLEEMVSAREGRVLLAKINVDGLQELAMEFNVASVPTVIGFRDGAPVEQFVGMRNDAELSAFINRVALE